MTDPQHLPDWRREEDEANRQTYEEEREWRDRRNPRDHPTVYLPRAESEEDDESH